MVGRESALERGSENVLLPGRQNPLARVSSHSSKTQGLCCLRWICSLLRREASAPTGQQGLQRSTAALGPSCRRLIREPCKAGKGRRKGSKKNLWSTCDVLQLGQFLFLRDSFPPVHGTLQSSGQLQNLQQVADIPEIAKSSSLG